MAKTQPTMEMALETLTQQRLAMLGREFGVAVSDKAKKAEQIAMLARPGITTFTDVLRALARNELKAICRKHGIDDEGRSRRELWERILESGGREKAPKAAKATDPYVPKKNDVAQVRHRQWLVEGDPEPGEHDEATLVRLVCLDDDSQGSVSTFSGSSSSAPRSSRRRSRGSARWVLSTIRAPGLPTCVRSSGAVCRRPMPSCSSRRSGRGSRS